MLLNNNRYSLRVKNVKSKCALHESKLTVQHCYIFRYSCQTTINFISLYERIIPSLPFYSQSQLASRFRAAASSELLHASFCLASYNVTLAHGLFRKATRASARAQVVVYTIIHAALCRKHCRVAVLARTSRLASKGVRSTISTRRE